MITVKGTRVALTLGSGRKLSPPAGAALLHDESGRDWPSCSALVAPFHKTGEKLAEVPESVRRYYGDGFVLRRGEMKSLPPKGLAAWSRVGEVSRIDYTRRGAYADNYWHPFGESGFLVWKDGLPVLYRRGPILRLELGSGCVWNWRGIVRP